MQSGVVEAIYLGAASHEDLRAVVGEGLEGDRYFKGDGTFYKPAKEGQDLTLIEAEALEGLAREAEIELEPGPSRRNVVTRGIALNDLVGRRFTVARSNAWAGGCATPAATSSA